MPIYDNEVFKFLIYYKIRRKKLKPNSLDTFFKLIKN